MFDILQQLMAIHREASRRPGSAGELISVRVSRTYDAAIADVWSALTDRTRLARWMFPIEGELRVGGSFQFKGNAGGEILACEPPSLLRVTYGGPTSLVEVRLTARGEEATDLVLDHTVPIEIARSVAGALFVGPGWDTGLAALDLYLRAALGDATEFHGSPEVQTLGARSVEMWVAVVAAGGATSDEVSAARAAALSHFAPDAPSA